MLFLICFIFQRHKQYELEQQQGQPQEELDQQRRQQQQKSQQDRQRENLGQRYQALLQERRPAHQKHLQQRLRQKRRRPPQIEYVGQQGPTSSSTDTQLRGFDGNSAVEGTMEKAIHVTTAPAQEVEGQTSEQPEVYSSLCENCEKFFRLRLSGPPKREQRHSETLSAIRQNAMDGCSVCALISRKLKNRPVKVNEPVVFTIEPFEAGWQIFSPFMDILIMPLTDCRSENTSLDLCCYTELLTNFAACCRLRKAS